MKILLHSSKSMKPVKTSLHGLTTPLFINEAAYLNGVLAKLSQAEIMSLMKISKGMAANVQEMQNAWEAGTDASAAATTFRGDIYSGLSALDWSKEDAAYAQSNLLIMSGLYGLLRPFDGIKPYRLEMGYKLKLASGINLEKYWENELTDKLNPDDSYINLTAKEYFKVIQKQLSNSKVLSPKFLTVKEKTGLPVFVTVHAKIARGSFANWLIKNKVDNTDQIIRFDQLNYKYDKALSTENEPVFVCHKFGGLGLSVRLK